MKKRPIPPPAGRHPIELRMRAIPCIRAFMTADRSQHPLAFLAVPNSPKRQAAQSRRRTASDRSAGPFIKLDVAVERKIEESFDEATWLWPLYFHPVYFGPRAQAQHDTRIVRSKKASTADFLACPFQIPGLPADLRTHRIAVCLLAHKVHSKPMVARGSNIAQQQGIAVIYGDLNVDSSIVVEASHGQAARREFLPERAARLCAYVFEPMLICAAGIAEQEQWLLVCDIGETLVDMVVRVAVRENQVKIAIVVEIEEFQPPAAHQKSCFSDSVGIRYIVKHAVMLVAVESVFLMTDVDNNQVHPTILFIGARTYPHPGCWPAVFVVRFPRDDPALFEPSASAI